MTSSCASSFAEEGRSRVLGGVEEGPRGEIGVGARQRQRFEPLERVRNFSPEYVSSMAATL